ncbi:MAG: hypothetical protein L3K15_09505, partial [Thermoplasmata archaeon]|nr:hypothetical protein [Thermoplasmata archaeon]
SLQSVTGGSFSATVTVRSATMVPFGSAVLQSQVGQLTILLGLSAPIARWLEPARARSAR